MKILSFCLFQRKYIQKIPFNSDTTSYGPIGSLVFSHANFYDIQCLASVSNYPGSWFGLSIVWVEQALSSGFD